YGPGGSSVAPQRLVFHEDAAGRCDRVETYSPDAATLVETETRAYDPAGRLARVDVTSAQSSVDRAACGALTMVNSYDEQGRLVETRQWCGGKMGPDPDRLTTISYGADGSQRKESFDFVTDVVNDVVPASDGRERSASHLVLTRSPDCAVIDAAIGAPS